MPTLISRGAASAKAFGLTNGSLNLTTTTFTSNGTWVAPAGVALVIVLSGRGQDGSPYNIDNSPVFGASSNPGPLPNSPPATWDTIYGKAVASQAACAARIGLSGPSSVETVYTINVDPTLKWAVNGSNTDDFSGFTVFAVTSIYASYGSPSTTGTVAYGVGFNAWGFTVTLTVPGFLGSSSTGLGQTFPGGNGGPAPVTTFNNIAVTPGASYPIVVAPGGYVTIQYLAP
jgi:hypothetical protein